jgi:hypothetical protein
VNTGTGELTGTYDPITRTFIATGNGTYAGYLTTFIFDGYFTPTEIFVLLTIGGEGGLPGGLAIIYLLTLAFM